MTGLAFPVALLFIGLVLILVGTVGSVVLGILAMIAGLALIWTLVIRPNYTKNKGQGRET